MKRIICLFFLLSTYTCFAQTAPKKIKIVLFGTFHFSQSLDSTSKLHSNLFSPKRQAEISEMVDKLAAFGPTKIFVENEPVRQPFWDSLYKNFKNGINPEPKRLANEIVQIGFKTAKKLNLSGVTCVDFQPENFGDTSLALKYATDKTIQTLWKQIAQYEDSVRTNAVFFDRAYPLKRPKQDSLLQKSTLSEFILQLNTPESYAYFTWSDWNWFYSLGRPDEYIGADWLANFWYGRNMRIYSNILRQAGSQNEEKYLLVYGASHMPFLQHLFEMNPFFEVVGLKDVLK